MGFHDIDSILANIEHKDKTKLLDVEKNIQEGLNELRKINNVIWKIIIIQIIKGLCWTYQTKPC